MDWRNNHAWPDVGYDMKIDGEVPAAYREASTRLADWSVS